jgi:hypothetical protein
METLDLEVFRAGDFGERGHWTAEALEQMAEDYDASLHEAPVTVDHAQSGPALGWVESLRRVGDVLVARLRDLDPGFAGMIRRGAFKKRSVELYRGLSETGRPYLRAVSFLGACPPAVKGLADVVFAEGDGDAVHVEFVEAASEVENAPDEMSWPALRDRLAATGRWLPAWEESPLCTLWVSLGESQRELIACFLESLPAPVPTERLAHAIQTESFADGLPRASRRAEVSSDSVAIHRRAVALRDERPELSYSEALRAVARGA